MLHEPEQSIVAAWIAAGHAPQIVPFGVSGDAWTFAAVARQSGCWGSMRRYGGLHIEAEALPYIADGLITAAQARVGFVWGLLRINGPMSVPKLSKTVFLSGRSVRCVLDELIKMEAIEVLTCMKPWQLRAVDLPRAPHWTDYLQANARAA